MSYSTNDQKIMEEVLALAAQGRKTTQPNPMVGCIIVKDGEVVGRGYHYQAGELHAERVALDEAGDLARGATVYVSLEPCCHQGRTPPCTDALINAGVSKVITAMVDPNPMVSGMGLEYLRNNGIETINGLLEQEARWLNRGFISRMVRKKPWVILKTAATLDGRTAAFDGQSKWITSEPARQQVQHLRASCSAVITGIGTVLADDPSMNVRLDDVIRQPLRVVLDSQLRLPLDAKIITNKGTLLLFTVSEDQTKIAELMEMGVEVVQLSGSYGTTDGKVNLSAVLEELAKWQCNEVLIEAGQTLSGAFLQQGLVDEMALFYAGSILGDQGKSMFAFDQPLPFHDRIEYRISDVEKIGDDLSVRVVNQASVSELTEDLNSNLNDEKTLTGDS